VKSSESTRAIPARLRRLNQAVPLLLMALVITACGGGGSGSGASSGSQALWVPNFFGASLAVFTHSELRTSGDQAPHRANSSAALDHPNAVVFDATHNLWATNCQGSTANVGSISEFETSALRDLRGNSAPEPHVVLEDDGNQDYLDCPYGEVFDLQGDLWISNRFYPDIISYTPAQLQQGGALQPNTQITANAFQSVVGIMFDSAGTLWITDIANSEVYGYKASTLAGVAGTQVQIEPDIINTSPDIGGPSAIAFDRAGNQWVANCGHSTLVKFDSQDITQSGSPDAAIVIGATTVMVANGDANSLDCPGGLAFDKQGNLWVANALSDQDGSLAEFSASQLTASGSPAPKVFIDSDPNGTNLHEPGLIAFGPTVP
jgi:hypothetical protein